MDLPKERHSGMFKPGQSGNPSGRPKMDESVRDLARAHTKGAVETLIEIASNPKASDAARVQACNAILDRGWGKPAQTTQSLNVNYSYHDFLVDCKRNDEKEALDQLIS